MPLGRAHTLASSVISEAHHAGIGTGAMTAVGGLRRFAPEVSTVALLAVVPIADHERARLTFTRLPLAMKVTADTGSSVTAATAHGPIALHLSPPEQAGAALVWHTGARAHVDELRSRASRLGLQFDDGVISRADGLTLLCTSEEDLYAALGLPFIAPELRSGDGEIDAAERGALPRLVSDRHIRGDLHTHSTWSDGSDPIADMVAAAGQHGYEYIAITDHFERAAASPTLRASDVSAQRDEIEALRATVPSMDILHGVEVDIMRNGSLDFDDNVLASLHDGRGDGEMRLTERYLCAIRHPLVNVITHPTNRRPSRSHGYSLDLDRLFAAAATSGTAMEVDGAPDHLDMDGSLARRAAATGVTIAIYSDCHRVGALGRQMQRGVGTARRGWVEAQHVLNTRGPGEVRAFVARKRRRS
jgi:DNA polymerase (family 10)